MMGTSHAVSGAAVFLAVTSPAPGLGLLPMEPVLQAAGAVVCAGAALLPDADHPHATIAYSMPGGSLVTGAIGAASGGHRKGLHSLLAVAAAFVGAGAVAELTVTPEGWSAPVHVGAGIMAACCVAFAVKVLKLVRSWPAAWGVGVLLAVVMTWFFPEGGAWLLPAITIGYATHLAGDFITSGGVPWLWPLMPKPPRNAGPAVTVFWRPGGAFAVPILGATGSWREQILTLAMTAYIGWIALSGFGMQ